VATRKALAHPLANAILATVLANEAVNRCGPLMIRALAEEHAIDDTEVVVAWGLSWAALNLAPVFAALDGDALLVPREVSIEVDARTRVLFKSVLEGALAVTQSATVDGMEELTGLFADGSMAAQLSPAPAPDAANLSALPPSFVNAWKAVDAIEAVATFLFAAVSVQRPAGMSLAQFLQVGMALRGKAGIDTLERGLKLTPSSKSQEQLRNYAMQALRRTQQRLLMQVLARSNGGTQALDAVGTVATTMGLVGYAAPADLEQAMLDVWALSEATNGVAA
jgi:glutamate dehydrogenase